MQPVRKVRGFWEPHEIEILRNVYPTGGAYGVKELLPERGLSAITEKCHQLGITKDPELTARLRSEAAKAAAALKKKQEDPVPGEYLQAADIFQVGYRIAEKLGVVHEYA